MSTSLRVSTSLDQASFGLEVINNGPQRGIVLETHCVVGGCGEVTLFGPALGKGTPSPRRA